MDSEKGIALTTPSSVIRAVKKTVAFLEYWPSKNSAKSGLDGYFFWSFLSINNNTNVANASMSCIASYTDNFIPFQGQSS